MPPVQLSPDTHWRLKTSAIIAGAVAFGVAVWGIGEAWGAKADVKDVKEVNVKVEEIKEKFHELDKKIIGISERQEQGLRGQQDMTKKLDIIIDALLRRDGGNMQPPGATPNPLRLDR